MTTIAPTVSLGKPGPAPVRLIRSELLKIRTTNVWWLFGIGVFLFTALALVVWIAVGNSQINAAASAGNEPFTPAEGASPAEIEGARQQFEIEHSITRTLVSVASQIYTSGQFFGLMFVMLLGVILVTNEFFHQTATATFLTTPHRTAVIFAKLATAMLAALFFWIFTTAINLVAGSIFFSIKGYGPQLDQWPVIRAILFNGLGFGLWGILGVGLGVLIRSQIGAVLTGAVTYVLGTQAVQIVAFLIYQFWIKETWVLTSMVAWPAVASNVMISSEQAFPYAPDWWVGLLVLIGYGLVFGTIGTLITRKRDVS
jgi:hypothetical protein